MEYSSNIDVYNFWRSLYLSFIWFLLAKIVVPTPTSENRCYDFRNFSVVSKFQGGRDVSFISNEFFKKKLFCHPKLILSIAFILTIKTTYHSKQPIFSETAPNKNSLPTCISRHFGRMSHKSSTSWLSRSRSRVKIMVKIWGIKVNFKVKIAF